MKLPSLLLLSIFIGINLNAQNYVAGTGASAGSGTDNTVVGANAGNPGATQSQNAIFGHDAGASMLNGEVNAFFGNEAGHNNTSGDRNSFFGEDAGFSNNTGENNSFFGNDAGRANTTGFRNAFFGWESGLANIDGTQNAYFGSQAGRNNNNGSANAYFGEQAGRFGFSGSENSYFGFSAGLNNAGEENVFVGNVSGFGNTSGSFNTYVGSETGIQSMGSGNVFIGRGSGPELSMAHVDMRLFIDVDTTGNRNNNPLIYGEFDNDFIKINGTFEVIAGLSNHLEKDRLRQFATVDEREALEKIVHLDIKKWVYTDRPHEQHISPSAEEFYEQFGLGEGPSKITTFDADGVIMLAIKALKKENDELRKLINQLLDEQDSIWTSTPNSEKELSEQY